MPHLGAGGGDAPGPAGLVPLSAIRLGKMARSGHVRNVRIDRKSHETPRRCLGLGNGPGQGVLRTGAVMTMCRVTGKVVRTERNTGVSKAGTPYNIRQARIMIGEVDFCDVRLPDDMPDLRQGDQVDYAVEYQGEYRNQPTFGIKGDWATVPGVRELVAAGK